MTHDFTSALDAIVALLAAKGFHSPTAELIIRDSSASTPFRLEASYRTKPNSLNSYISVRHYNLHAELGREPTIEDAFADLREQIAELPTQREQEIKEFVNQMEALKASAEDLGVDGDFMTPIVALMNKLASNALPKPKR
jgi:hypothetical protein